MKKIDYEKSKNYGWKFDEEAIDFSVKETPLAFLCVMEVETEKKRLYQIEPAFYTNKDVQFLGTRVT